MLDGEWDSNELNETRHKAGNYEDEEDELRFYCSDVIIKNLESIRLQRNTMQLGIIARKRNKLYSELLTSGTKVKGRVEKVYLQEYTHYGRQSPYRIRYSYSYKDKVYHHKSYFIWEKPHLTSGDTVMICVNDFGKSTILL